MYRRSFVLWVSFDRTYPSTGFTSPNPPTYKRHAQGHAVLFFLKLSLTTAGNRTFPGDVRFNAGTGITVAGDGFAKRHALNLIRLTIPCCNASFTG